MRHRTIQVILFFMLLTIFVGLIASGALAQTTRVGAKGAFQLNQFTQPGTSVGYGGGAFCQLVLLDFMDVRVEATYSLIGGGREDYLAVIPGSNNTGTIFHINPYLQFHTIEVPLLLEFGLPGMKLEPVQPVLLLGGGYNFMFSAREKFTKQHVFSDGTIFNQGYQSEKVNHFYKQNQFSYIFGLGLNFNLPRNIVKVDVRYRQGINQLNNNMIAIPETGGRLYSSSLAFSIGTTF